MIYHLGVKYTVDWVLFVINAVYMITFAVTIVSYLLENATQNDLHFKCAALILLHTTQRVPRLGKSLTLTKKEQKMILNN